MPSFHRFTPRFDLSSLRRSLRRDVGQMLGLKKSARRSRRPNRSARALAGMLPVILCGTVALTAVGMLSMTPAARAYPEPSIVPIAWQLDFENEAPRRIIVDVPGEGSTAYWYMVYTVANNTGEERLFLPQITMLTRDGQNLLAPAAVPPAVFQAIQEQRRSLNLVPPSKVAGRLLVGEDLAKTSVAVWKEPMAEMGTFDIFVAGLSGEIVPLTDREGNVLTDENGNRILLRKTKHLTYKIRGDEQYPQRDEVVKLDEKWVMR